MKNLFLLFSFISIIACQEEKPKKIKINTNLMCKPPVDYKVQQPGVAMLKENKRKIKFVNKSEQTK